MTYSIEYFKDGLKIGSASFQGALEAAQQHARKDAPKQAADFVRIIDVADTNASGTEIGSEIWSEHINA